MSPPAPDWRWRGGLSPGARGSRRAGPGRCPPGPGSRWAGRSARPPAQDWAKQRGRPSRRSRRGRSRWGGAGRARPGRPAPPPAGRPPPGPSPRPPPPQRPLPRPLPPPTGAAPPRCSPWPPGWVAPGRCSSRAARCPGCAPPPRWVPHAREGSPPEESRAPAEGTGCSLPGGRPPPGPAGRRMWWIITTVPPAKARSNVSS